MTPFVSTSGQRGLIRRAIWLGSRALVILALASAALYYGCGRVPPEPFWEPSAEDTVAIKQVVEENKSLFMLGLSEAGFVRCTTALPGSTQTILDAELTGNPFKQRFRCDSIQHIFSAHDFEYTFIATLDTLEEETTCTVTYAETIPGELKLRAYRMTDSLRESLFFPSPGETLRLPLYTDTWVTRSAVVTKPISATTAGGCVLKKQDGKWSIWKVSGGTRFHAPNPDDAPYFVRAVLSGGVGRYDTVLLRPDTMHYGLQRFFAYADTTTGGILTYRQSDTLRLASLQSNLGNDGAEYLYFNGQRYVYNNPIILATTPPGVYHFYIEEVPPVVLWEVNGNYSATVWAIPVRVK